MCQARQNVRCQGCRAGCCTLKPSNLGSDQACHGKVAVCQGVKVLSPDIYDYSCCIMRAGERARSEKSTYEERMSSHPHLHHTTCVAQWHASCEQQHCLLMVVLHGLSQLRHLCGSESRHTFDVPFCTRYEVLPVGYQGNLEQKSGDASRVDPFSGKPHCIVGRP